MKEVSPSKSPQSIWDMRYPDFVALIDQENTPPGALDTLKWWIHNAAVTTGSTILDLACTTGFSSRTVAKLTGCRGCGIDLSEPAVCGARARAALEGLQSRLNYEVGNAEALPYAEATFSHIVAGSCFGFFRDPQRALEDSARVLVPGGRLCISSFYYTEPPPDVLLDKVAACVGYRPDPRRDKQYWEKFFSSRFTLETESVIPLTVHAPADVCSGAANYVSSIVHRFGDVNDVTREAIVFRLARDRLMFNEHRRYQACARYVWRRS